MKKFDIIIIGFGKGGKTLASEYARRGKSVAIVEQSDKMYGGTCINIGCIPTKTLVHKAKQALIINNSSYPDGNKFFMDAIAAKDKVVSMLRDKNYHLLADNPNVTVYNGHGSFSSKNEIEVSTAKEKITITSEMIIIDTGAETVIPPIPGIKSNPFVFTSTSVMELKNLPKKLIIIGGGYIGLEFANMFASFGSMVTVLEGGDELIPREDRDIAAAVKSSMEKRGVTFVMNAKVESVGQEGSSGAEVNWSSAGNKMNASADAVLLATGRKPNIEGLNLEIAGIETDTRGAIKTDNYLVTTNPNVRAIGDVKGGLQFTYISLDDYRIIREDVFGNASRKTSDRDAVPYSVFIDPQLSRVGISESEARAKNLDVIVKSLPVNSVPKAETLGESEGVMKAIIDAKNNKILGCTLFSPDSAEIINIVTLAMKAGLTASFLRDSIFTHPSMAESLNDLFAI